MYFDELPVELVYRIFDLIDYETILSNIRYVSKRLYILTKNYNRNKIDLRSIRMIDFDICCKELNPLNITELILSNDEKTIGLIKYFLSKYELNQFKNVRYLTLSHIEDKELEISLEQISNLLLNKLSIIKFDLYDNKEIKYKFLSNVLTQTYLKKVDLEFRLADVKEFPWPNQCYIESLRIGNTIRFEQFYTILNQTPFLKRFILKDCSNKDLFEIQNQIFEQINSLTFENSRMDKNQLELIVASTPNLIHLTLFGNMNLSHGFYLENLIKNHLPLLNKFTFYFYSNDNNINYSNDFQPINQSYQSPFWLQQRKWFINSDLFVSNGKSQMRLYSLPLSYHKLEFYSDNNKQSFTTYYETDQSLMTMDSVQQLTVDLDQQLLNTEFHNNDERCTRFNYVTQLKLLLNENLSIETINYLSNLINLSKLTTFTLIATENSNLNTELRENIRLLLERSANVDTLSLTSGQSPLTCKIRLDEIFSMVSPNIKHLQVMVRDFDEVRLIIEKLPQLSSIKFQIVRFMARSFSENRPSVIQIRQGSTCQKMDPHLEMWLGRL